MHLVSCGQLCRPMVLIFWLGGYVDCAFTCAGGGRQPPRIVSIHCLGALDRTAVMKKLHSGVFIDSSFKPSLRCKEAYARTRATFFMIRRGFAIVTPAIFRPLYLAMVLPHLDYAVQASFPYRQKDIKLIERMQWLATRVSEGYRTENASTNSNVPRWSDTFSVLLSSRCTSSSTVT